MMLLLIILAGFYVVFCFMIFLYQKRLLYYPERGVFLNPGHMQMDYEPVTLESGENGEASIVGCYVPSERDRATLLFCHGNAGNISNRLESIKQFSALGLNVFIFDYRGYGESRGPLTEKGTYDDALAAWRYLTETRGEAPERIIVFGRSLGGAVAVWLATQVEPAALIVESSFTSVVDMGRKLYPYLPIRLLARYRYNSLARLRDIHCPTLFIHSPDDNLVPYEYGRRLFEAANEPREFLDIRGMHNDGYLISEDVYLPGIDAFLKRVLPAEAEPLENAGN